MKSSAKCGITYKKNPLYKRLAVTLAFFIIFAGTAWGDVYRFAKSTTVDAGTPHDTWNDYESWKARNVIGGSWATPSYGDPPGNNTGDDVYFFGENSATCSVTVTPTNSIRALYINRKYDDADTGNYGPTTIDIASGVTLESGSLTVTRGTFILSGSGTLNITGTVTVLEGATLQIGPGVTFTAGTIINNGTIQASSSGYQISCTSLKQSSTGTIKDFTSITAESIGDASERFSGTLEISSDAEIIVSGAFYNASDFSDTPSSSLKITADGFDTTGKISLTNDASLVTLQGALIDGATGSSYKKISVPDFTHYTGSERSFYSSLGTAKISEIEVAASGSDKQFILNGGEIDKFIWDSATASVLNVENDTLIKEISLSGGSGTGEELTLKGSGSITTTQNNTGLQYLKFTSNDSPKVLSNPAASAFTFSFSDSVPYNDGEFPSGWEYSYTEYTWNGSVSTDWFKGSNWDEGIVPTSRKKITIPAGCTNYPKIPATKNIETGDFVISGGSFESEGQVTVQGDLSVSGNTEFIQKENLSVTGDCSVSGTAQFSINQKDNSSSIFEGTLVFSNTGGGINTGKTGSSITVNTGGITFPSGLSWLSLGGTIDSAGKTIIKKDFALAADLVFKDDVEVTVSISLPQTNTKKITFEGKSDFGNNDVTVGNSTIHVSLAFKDNVTNLKDLTVFGSLEINKAIDLGALKITGRVLTALDDISLTGDFIIAVSGTTSKTGKIKFIGSGASVQTFNSHGQVVFESIIVESGAKVNQTEDIEIQKDLINSGTYTFESGKKVVFSGKEDSEISGVYSFQSLEIKNTEDAVKIVKLPASTRTDSKGINVSGAFSVTGKEFSDSGVQTKNIVLTASGTPGNTDTTWWYLENAGSVSVSNCEIRYAYSENDISGNVTSSVDYKAVDGAYTTYNWFSQHPYYWYGDSGDHKWTTAGNWSTDSSGSPALTGGAPRYSDATAKIYIKKGTLTEPAKQLELDNDVDVLSFEVDSDFRVNLKDKKITAKKITNNGILALDGSIESPLVYKTGGSITHGDASVIEFNGWSTSAINTTYQGLGLNQAAPAVSAFKNLKIVGTGTIDFTSKIPDINVSGTTECSGAITLKSSSFIFNGDVTGDNDLAFSGGVTFNCSNVTTTGKKQIYENEASIKKDITLSASEITFKDDISGIVAGPNDAQGNPTQLIRQLSLNTPKILTPRPVNFDCKVKVLQAASFDGSAAVTFKRQVTSNNTNLTFNTDITLSGGSVNSGNGEQIYNNPLTLSADTELTASKITFNDKVEGSYNFTVNGPCVFDSSSSDTVITSDKTQNYKNTVTLSKDVSLTGLEIIFGGTVSGANNLSVTGKTTIEGGSVITTGKNQTYLGDIVLGDNTVLTGDTITLGKEILLGDGSYQRTSISGKSQLISGVPTIILKDLEINAATKAELFGSVGVAKFDMNGDAEFNSVSLANTGVFTLFADKTVNLNGVFKQTGTGKNHIKGSFKSSGTNKISFATDVYFDGNPSVVLSFGGASGLDSEYITLSKNLIVALGTGKELKIESSLKADNIVLYGGKLSVNQNIESVKDFVLVGSNYVEGGAAPSVSGEYKYNKLRPASDSQVQYTSFGTDKFPDDSALPAYSGELSVTSGKILKAGKNFFANGLNLYGSGEWYLDCGKNSDPHNCFVEAYKCDIKNSVVRLFENGTSTENSELTCGMAEECTGDLPAAANRNWDFSDFKINSISTVNDSVLRVEFSQKIRNLYGELKNNISNIYFNNDSNDEGFSNVYKDYHFDSATNAWVSVPLGSNEEIDKIFIKTEDDADSRWNTDACGDGTNVTSGHANSTDSYGVHQNVKPEVKFTRTLTATERLLFTNRFGKVLKDSGDFYKHILDGAAPVLVALSTGQEVHSQGYAATQPSYDAHNFIEFVYSEPVNVSDADSSGTINMNAFASGTTTEVFQNTKVSSYLGKITETADGIKIEGLAEIASGRLETGNINTNLSDSEVHGFYRKSGMSPQSLRISVAGFTDGTVSDNLGNSFKKWVGYIDNAVTPSGTVVLSGTSCVKDLAVDASGNPLPNAIQNVKSGGLSVSTPASSDYGKWDTVKPSFAVTRKATLTWDGELKNKPYEAIGSTVDSSSSLKRIEFHVFDNEPLYDISSNEKEWVSRKGWVNHYDPSGTVGSYATADSYAADIFGGARPFDAVNRTSGGIRYSSIFISYDSFKYDEGTDLSTAPTRSFDSTTKPYYGASSPIFIPTTGSIRTPSASDTPYFGLKLESNVASLKTRFVVDYNGDSGFVTDLAGNRMASARIQTTDTTPPSFAMALAAQGQDKLYLMFAKNLEFGDITIKDSSHNEDTKSALVALPDAFTIGTIASGASQITPSADIGIDTTVPAQVIFRNNDYCGIQLKLTREVKYEDIKNLYVAAKPIGNNYLDPITELPSDTVTFIQDELGNYMQAKQSHAFSDFAVDVINPLYAYNQGFINSNSTSIQDGLYSEESQAVHDWNEEQKNFGTLLPKDEIHIVVGVNDSDLLLNTTEELQVKLFIDNDPDSGSVSSEYNKITNSSWRIWLPNEGTMFQTISPFSNVPSFTTLGTYIKNTPDPDLTKGIDFTVPKTEVEKWSSGNQVSFLFGMMEYDGSVTNICHSPVFDYSTGVYSINKDSPLFALRLKNPSDILSLDLWSFRLKTISDQRGGVTVLNNVINAGRGEKAVIKIDNVKSGHVDVIIMTLDGNIIDYLNRGELAAGTTNFTWNGKNRNGREVARGLYFVRVIGNDFDETRKIMVVK